MSAPKIDRARHGPTENVTPVMAIGAWRNNAEMIADVARLGYFDGTVLDATYGRGGFWRHCRPSALVACDIAPTSSDVHRVDFTDMPFPDQTFDAVVFDPPYKMNGTTTPKVDAPYGVHEVASVAGRRDLFRDGMSECARVLKVGGFLLVKCQDQVCGGDVRWQTDWATRTATERGLVKVDRFDLLSYRPQPAGRSQQHARRNHSTLLVFQRRTRCTRGEGR